MFSRTIFLCVCVSIYLSSIYSLSHQPTPTASITLKYVPMNLQSSRLIHPPVYVTSPFDAPQHPHRDFSQIMSPEAGSVWHWLSNSSISELKSVWFSWPFPCGCTRAAVASASQLHSTQEEKDMQKGKGTSKKLHQWLPSFPWILQSDGVSYLYIVLVGIMPTYCSHCRNNKEQEEPSPWLNQASPYNLQPAPSFFPVPLLNPHPQPEWSY